MDTKIIFDALDLLKKGNAAQCENILCDVVKDAEISEISPPLLALAYDGIGRAAFAQRRVEEGLAALNKSVDIMNAYYKFCPKTEKEQVLSTLIRALQNLSFAYSSCGKFKESIAFGHEAIKLAEENFGDQSSLLAESLFRISSAYYRLHNYDEAEKCILRAKSIWEAQAGVIPEQVGTCLNNLGRIYEEQGEFAKGIDFHKQAVAFRRKMSNREDLAFSLGNLGVAYAQNGNWPEAINALEESIKIYNEIGMGQSPEVKAYSENLKICRAAFAQED